MKNLKKKTHTVKLKNKYHNEYVFCDNIDDVIKEGNYQFIKVYKQENLDRIFLVNKEAFVVEKI